MEITLSQLGNVGLLAALGALAYRHYKLVHYLRQRREMIREANVGTGPLRQTLDEMSKILSRLDQINDLIDELSIDDGSMGHSYSFGWRTASGEASTIEIQSRSHLLAAAEAEREGARKQLADVLARVQVL